MNHEAAVEICLIVSMLNLAETLFHFAVKIALACLWSTLLQSLRAQLCGALLKKVGLGAISDAGGYLGMSCMLVKLKYELVFLLMGL